MTPKLTPAPSLRRHESLASWFLLVGIAGSLIFNVRLNLGRGRSASQLELVCFAPYFFGRDGRFPVEDEWNSMGEPFSSAPRAGGAVHDHEWKGGGLEQLSVSVHFERRSFQYSLGHPSSRGPFPNPQSDVRALTTHSARARGTATTRRHRRSARAP